MSNLSKKIRLYSQITDLGPTCRRYFVIGAFDGALTILGVILGAIALGGGNEKVLIIGASVGAGIALAISSTVGAYEAERVERMLHHERHRSAMLSEPGEIQKAAFRFASLISSFVHGIAPLIAALIPLIPILVLPFESALIWSVATTLVFLFVLGAYLGTIAKEFPLMTGLRFVVVGLATAALLYLLGLSGLG